MNNKFRAWDKKVNRFIQHVHLNDNGSVSFLNSKALWQFDKTGRIILQFFTGLKDNTRTEEFPKGKEIYFNDICKLTVELDFDEGCMNHWYIGIVSFMPSLGYYLNVKKGFDINNDKPLISPPKIKHIVQYRTELLGNYFEDKNLLES